MTIDPVKLARLAADERTPEHERAAAAMALAKIVARDGMPPSVASTRSSFGYSPAAQQRIGELCRERDALAAINGQNAAELATLRADKADLEERVSRRDRQVNRLLEGIEKHAPAWKLEIVWHATEPG